MKIRRYRKEDEQGWLRCRVISFLDSAYYDDVQREKEKYENPAVELVAEADGKIVGLIDVEYEKKVGDAAYKTKELAGVIWHIAVLPEYRNQGIAGKLLEHAIQILKQKNIKIIQAWTRDDEFVLDWYKNRKFEKRESYWHVFSSGDECDEISKSKINKLYICNTFCHYNGDNPEEIKKKFERVHECNLFEKKI